MPSTRKRIGYLPSINAQETITKIANKEKLSQSKVVGILVEEALLARGGVYLQKSNELIRKNHYSKKTNMYNSSFNYNDLDELISDKGITYNKKFNSYSSEINVSEGAVKINEELFEQFRQFILFQKMTQD
tara:strand:- start:177 stop:569 length:393 start_codon:yes stop_codon:yes gene_type:complete